MIERCTMHLLQINAHSPVESPLISSHSVLVSPGHEIRLAVHPRLIVSSPLISGIPVTKRNCYFANERKLKYFQTYTESNCRRECLADYSLEECGCIPFYLPGK